MVIHLIVLLILALIASPAGEKIGSILLTAGQSESEDATAIAEFQIDSVEIPVDSELPFEEVAEIELPSILDSVQAIEPIEVQPEVVGQGELDITPETLPMFGGRTGALRQTLLDLYGGTPETEEAVRLGLHWLRRNQRRDGSWSLVGPFDDGARSENRVAATAMALLAFLGDGNTHVEGEFSKVVQKGMKALLKMQDRTGFFSKGRVSSRNDEGKMYAQAQATIAVCELYGLTKDSWLRPHAQAAIDFAEDSQSSKGGWRYQPKFDSDTSVTGWFMLALESGKNAGLEVKSSTFKRIGYYLDSAQHGDGAGYGYQEHSSFPSTSMTAEGLLCRQYLGWRRDHSPMAIGIEALQRDQPFSLDDQNVYYWYYTTQVLHHFGGSPWRQWNEVMRVELPKLQVRRGSEIGSFPSSNDQYGYFGRLYTTCLSIYCLEVYYRHLPLYTPQFDREPADDQNSVDDVVGPESLDGLALPDALNL